MAKRRDLIGTFVTHPVAMNLLMALTILIGVWGLFRLNAQTLPTVEPLAIQVLTVWKGANPDDVEQSLTEPIEQALVDIADIDRTYSISREGRSSVLMHFTDDADMIVAREDVKSAVEELRTLPSASEIPRVIFRSFEEDITQLLITGATRRELRPLAYRFRDELLQRGIPIVEIHGLPDDEIAIQVPNETLHELGLSLEQIGQAVSSASRDVPLGILGREVAGREVRFQDKRRRTIDFATIPVVDSGAGRLVTLGDIAEIERRIPPGENLITYQGQPAVFIRTIRNAHANAIRSSRVIDEWIEETQLKMPPGIEIVTVQKQTDHLRGRISLFVKNGLAGMSLVLIVLFVFLQGRVALWVAVGILTAIMGALGVLYLLGQSINMLSLFGLLLAIGIAVDDSIVVGEAAATRYSAGESAQDAAEGAIRQMMMPVVSSSLTTIAAFFPILVISGVIGRILEVIPIAVICVIVASLVECLLVLPGHLSHSLRHAAEDATGTWVARFRNAVDSGVERIREERFRPFVQKATEYRYVVIAGALSFAVVTGGVLAGGYLSFNFFPVPEGTEIHARVGFVSGTPEKRVRAFLENVAQKAWEIGGEADENVVHTVFVDAHDEGPQYGTVVAILADSEAREMTNRVFSNLWEERIERIPGLSNFAITERKIGPAERDIDLVLSGEDVGQLKRASEAVQRMFSKIPGVYGIEDNLPYGREQMVLHLLPFGESLGLTVDAVARQVHSAVNGHLVQILSEDSYETEVRVTSEDSARDTLNTLERIKIVLPNGETTTADNVVRVEFSRGFDSLYHYNGELSVTISADVDPAVGNTNRIIDALKTGSLPEIERAYGINASFEGQQNLEEESQEGIVIGAIIAFVLIYIIMAWVFGSYSWPILVMLIIPFGVVGAIIGHLVAGIDLTFLSLVGLLGLSGILMNDSIILVVAYRELLAEGLSCQQAAVEAACRRLRAVFLTSVTTIAGLAPLLLETSVQAEFLIPMALTIVSGLFFATALVLVLVPSLLLICDEDIRGLARSWKTALAAGDPAAGE